MTMLKRPRSSDGSGLRVNINTEALKGLPRMVWQDLRSKRLWPVALGLLVAVVAVPVLLSKSSTGSAQPPAPVVPPTTSGLPAVTQGSIVASGLHRSTRDPFSPQAGGTASSSSTVASTGSATSVPASTGAAVGTTGGTSTGPATSSGGSTPAPGTGGSTPTGPSGGNGSNGNGSQGSGSGGTTPPANPGLNPRQSYDVKLAITTTSGGIDTLDPLQRLMVLPSQSQPLMVELGVLNGGTHILFALEPGTTVSGPGHCIPGPIDCQVVSVGRNQVEHLGVRSASGIAPVALFAVTGISVVTHPSVSAAQKARQAYSAAGQTLLRHSTLSALSLFHYAPSVGAVVDMRNLTFGVN